MEKMTIHSSKNILLLGAGFTKNYGGLLSDEMWIEIFNHKKIQAQPRIKELMLEDFNYESIYYTVLDNPYSDDQKNAIIDATRYTYEHIDNILRQEVVNSQMGNNQRPNWVNTINKLLLFFCNTNENSFIFTLNQDLFIERFYHNVDNTSNRYYNARISIPGIDKCPEWFMDRYAPRSTKTIIETDADLDRFYKLKQDDFYKLPTEDMLKNRKSDLLADGSSFLIKLHGSYNWLSSDGTSAMVIGRGKTKQIQKEPLLKHYFEIFNEVLSQDNLRLLIIGYGFGDEHINHVISDSIKNHNLNIYILSPESPKDLKNRLFKISEELKKQSDDKFEDPINIWNGISGYFQCVEDVLLKDDTENSVVKQHFYDAFFGV